jgi:hypothetical protein
MNGLSWLLYIGGVAGSLGSFFSFLAVIFFFLGAVTLIMSLINPGKSSDELSAETIAWAKKARYFFLGLLIVFGSLASIMPSKETVYAVAASEMGEKVIKDPHVMQTTGKAFKALDSWLDKQVADGQTEADNAVTNEQ